MDTLEEHKASEPKVKLSPENVKQIEESVTNFQNFIRENETSSKNTIFIGCTGAGKSTVINYLSGRKCEAFMPKNGGGAFKIKVHDPLDGIVPGHSSTSQTETPGVWISEKKEAYWDCPGFGDTKGPIQDIKNAFYVNKVFNQSKPTKIVLVVGFDAVFANREHLLITLARDIARLGLLDSLSWVTMVVTSMRTDSVDMVKNRFSEEILGENKDKDLVKLIEFFVKNSNQIAVFPEPKNEGIVGPEIAETIKKVIDQNNNSLGVNVKLSLSSESRNFLNDLVWHQEKELIAVLSSIGTELMGPVRKILTKATDATHAKNWLKKLEKDIESIHQKDPIIFLEKYKEFCNEYSLNSVEKELSTYFGVLDFAETLDIKTSYNLENLTYFLDVVKLIQNLCKDVEESYESKDNEVLVIRSNIVDSTAVNKILEKTQENSSLKSIKVIALQVFYVNQNITTFGNNLEITSRSWKIDANRIIDLKGKNGEALAQYGSNLGKPGRPGYPGGNFWCYSDKVWGEGKLTINVSGGNGGDGINGRDGYDGNKGQDGNNNVTNTSAVLWQRCIDSDDTDYSNQIIYVNHGGIGVSGGNAGAGRKGGQGAKCGTVKVISDVIKEVIKEVISNSGAKGEDGMHGVPGTGGRYGNSYYRNYVVMKHHIHGTFKWGNGPVESGWRGGSYSVKSTRYASNGSPAYSLNTAGMQMPVEPGWDYLESYDKEGSLSKLEFKSEDHDIIENFM